MLTNNVIHQEIHHLQEATYMPWEKHAGRHTKKGKNGCT